MNFYRKEVKIIETEKEIKSKTLEQIAIDHYSQLAFSNLKKNVVQDLIKNHKESIIYRKYPKERIIKILENPQQNEKQICELSNFIYIVSPHYRRLINYYSKLPKFNYIITPYEMPITINRKKYLEEYNNIISLFEKYNIKQESTKIMQSVFRGGVFYGLTYESKDSFYIRPFDYRFATISSIEDGCFLFSIDLNYFADKDYLLQEYGSEITNAYYAYKGNKNLGIVGNIKLRWFEPSNGICIKADEDDAAYSLPPLSGLLLDILNIEDYSLLKKAKVELDNYKVLAMKMECDDDGIPKMDFELAKTYYNQVAQNIPDGIGLAMTPFEISDFSFQQSSVSETNSLLEAENDLFFSAGVSPLLFGSTKATSSSSISLSVKPDESISFAVMHQIGRFFNKKLKKINLEYKFQIKFLDQSIFNENDVSKNYKEASTYGVAGSKLLYAASIGMTPSDVSCLAYLEDKILKITDKTWTKPLISSNTMSNKSDSENGRPTNESKGEELKESGVQTKETDQNKNK